MKRRTTEELDSLLGRGSIGVSRRDAILRAVQTSVKAERSARSRWRWPLAWLGGAAAAATALLLVVPRFGGQPHEPPKIRAKGTAEVAQKPRVDIECLSASPGKCPLGSLAVVQVTGVRGYVSAWAVPAQGGERIWYFSAESSSPLVDGHAAGSNEKVRAVKIGPEHRIGKYIVEIRVTERPMSRDELLRLPAGAALLTERLALTVTSQ